MSRAISGVPPLNLRSTAATSSGEATGTADVDPNSFQLMVNWFMNNNVSNLAQIGLGGESGSNDSSSSFDSFFGNSSFGDAFSSSGSDPFSAMGLSNMQSIFPGLNTTSPMGNLAGLGITNPMLELQRLQSFNEYSSLVNEDNPSTASYTDPATGVSATGIIEEVIVNNNGEVSFMINGNAVPLSSVKSLTRAEEEA
jgi:hypothetical protein